jgi:hypothetical protein
MNAVAERDTAVKFGLEPYSEKLVQEMRPMWDAYQEEVFGEEFVPDPNLTMYSQSQKNATLRIFTARVGSKWESTLVGFQVVFVMNHPHRKYSLEACQDILYLDPEVRKGLVGLKFLKWCDRELIREGVKKITHQCRAHKNLGRIFERMGYTLTEYSYARRI